MEAMEQPPNKYAKGKIYKITDIGYNECYYGSTYNLLCKRMDTHRRNYKCYKNGKYHYVTIFSLFDKYGVENCKIELVELYPCGSKNELEMREGWYIQNNECVNKCVMGRTKKQWEEDNKEHLAEKRRQWVEANKEHLVEYQRQYHEINKEKVAEQKRQYNQLNKQKIAERNRQYYMRKKEKEGLI
jgi:adenylate kinase family enzyme